jgi:hypothetical protein
MAATMYLIAVATLFLAAVDSPWMQTGVATAIWYPKIKEKQSKK